MNFQSNILLKIWNHKTRDTFGTTVNTANIISLLLTLLLILKVESGAFVSLLHNFCLTFTRLLTRKSDEGESEADMK